MAVTANTTQTNKPRVETYPVTKAMERAMLTLVCCRPRLWGLIGDSLEEDALQLKASKLALRAAKAIARDTGSGPGKHMVVLQRLRRWMGDGQVTKDDMLDVFEMFEDAMDSPEGLPSEDDVLGEMVPILRRRLEKATIEKAFTKYQKRGDLTELIPELEKAKRLGVVDTNTGRAIGTASFEAIEAARHLTRLPTGIPELDDIINGGVPRGSMSMWLASTSGGKSMALVQNACGAALRSLNVCYASLELPPEEIEARIIANLTGELIDDVKEKPARAQRRLANLMKVTKFGSVRVKKFPPKATHFGEVIAWLKDVEEETGAPVHVLVLDYADKLRSKADPDADNTYISTGDTYEDIRLWAEEHQRWVWTGSQAQRQKESKTKKLGTDDTADSLNKSRVVDCIVSLNARDEKTQMLYHVAKNRFHRDDQSAGPVPTMFEFGRISSVVVPAEYEDALA